MGVRGIAESTSHAGEAQQHTLARMAMGSQLYILGCTAL
jgi:hypothetical protein